MSEHVELYAAILLCDPRRPSLSPALVGQAARCFGAAAGVDWLAPGIAAEILFEAEAASLADRRAELGARLGSERVDAAIVPAHARRKKLLVADMDSTMIAEECLDELAAEFGLKPQIAAITERAMRGEIAFEPALRERVALLAGANADAIETVLKRIAPMPGARTLIATMRKNGAYTALVSGGFTCFTGPVAERLGFDENRGNMLIVEEGRMVGRVQEPILGRDAKLAALLELRERFGLAPSETMAVGDGANDLAMLQAAGLGVAFHAKPAVAEAAQVRIDHGDLTALLYLQGYSQSEFAAG